MGINKESADKAEVIAKRMSTEKTGSDGMWELFLTEAYNELFNLRS